MSFSQGEIEWLDATLVALKRGATIPHNPKTLQKLLERAQRAKAKIGQNP